MDETITITRGQFQIMILSMCMEGYIGYCYRYFRISEQEANDLFYDVSEALWQRLVAGEMDLLLNPMRSIERVGEKINVKFLREQRLLAGGA